jgi:hypothetical protein
MMQPVPLKTLLFDYVDVLAGGALKTPYGSFLRVHVLGRLINLAQRRKKDFELWKQMQGKDGKKDEQVVDEALTNRDVPFFMWLCSGRQNLEVLAEGGRTRLLAWKFASSGTERRRTGKLFMRYLAENCY